MQKLKLIFAGLFAIASLVSVFFASYSVHLSSVGACLSRVSIQMTSGLPRESCPAPSSIDRVLMPLVGPSGFVEQWESIVALIDRLRQGTRDGVQEPGAKPSQSEPA